jgi:hypothetical protein
VGAWWRSQSADIKPACVSENSSAVRLSRTAEAAGVFPVIPDASVRAPVAAISNSLMLKRISTSSEGGGDKALRQSTPRRHPYSEDPMLIVNVANTNRDLTTLATIKDELGITDTSLDAKLSRYITEASGIIAEWCNRVFAIETVTETMRNASRRSYSISNPWQGQQQALILQRYPVVSLISISENDVLLDPSNYEVDAINGEIQRLDSNGQYSLWSAAKIVINYSAGFALPTGLPSGIERACIMLVKQFAASGDRDPMVQSERTDGIGSTQFFNAAGGLPPEVEGLISIHRKQNI